MYSISFGKLFLDIITRNVDIYAPREQCITVIQNVSCILSEQTKKKPSTANKFKAISIGCRDARMAYSIFKIFQDIKNVSIAFKKYNMIKLNFGNLVLSLFEIAVPASHFIYEIYENAFYFANKGVFNQKKVNRYSDIYGALWTLNILIVVGQGIYQLKQFKDSKDTQSDKLQKKIIYIDIISNVFDIPNAFGGSGIPLYLTGKTFCDTTIGIGSGIAASLSLWNYRLNEKQNKKV